MLMSGRPTDLSTNQGTTTDPGSCHRQGALPRKDAKVHQDHNDVGARQVRMEERILARGGSPRWSRPAAQLDARSRGRASRGAAWLHAARGNTMQRHHLIDINRR
jgi:hypothetical protein